MTPTPAPSPLARIVVGFDGSPPASRALAFALEIARPTRAHLFVVHVRERDAAQLEPTTEEESTSADDAIAAAVAGWAERAREAGIPFTPALRERPVADAILAVAAEVAPEMIVVGTRGLRAVSKVLLGSVSASLLARAGRPVLVVP
ncbi:MAG: universal stress protein [Thermoplasmata archaeon]